MCGGPAPYASSAMRPTAHTQQASSRATAALALHALLPAAASASRRRWSLAVQSSALERIAGGTSVPGAGALGLGELLALL